MMYRLLHYDLLGLAIGAYHIGSLCGRQAVTHILTSCGVDAHVACVEADSIDGCGHTTFIVDRIVVARS